MAKETGAKKLTDKTELALATLNELGGVATFAEVKELAKVGTANLTALVNAGLVTKTEKEVEVLVKRTVYEYAVVEVTEPVTADAE